MASEKQPERQKIEEDAKTTGETPVQTDLLRKDPPTRAKKEAVSSGVQEPKVAVDPAIEREAVGYVQQTMASRAAANPTRLAETGVTPTEPQEAPPDRRSDPTGPRYWGLPVWGWLLVIAAFTGVLFFTLDILNRNAYTVVCTARTVELHQGRRFPWPFGHVSIGGPEYTPFKVLSEADCWTGDYKTEDEAALSFLDLILKQVRSTLTSPQTANLKNARQQVQQALLLTQTHRTRRKETQSLQAELSYIEGRASLGRAESEIRFALSQFQEVQKLDATRFQDLDEWIIHLEELLRTLSPSPFSNTGGSASFQPFKAPGPSSRPLAPSSQPGITAPADEKKAQPGATDAGPPSSGGGILM